MDNAEEIMHFLEVFSKRKSKSIPPELNDYLAYVARTGDPVFQWGLVKGLFKEKLLSVLTDFHENSPGNDVPSYPNVDPFHYESMKNSLLERLDTFQSAPFTLQRICELLISPRKQYNRIDKYMRAIEKTILVVSTREPGSHTIEQDNAESADAINGSDNNSDYNVDVEMDDVSWKESRFNKYKAQPSSSNHKKSDEDDSDDDSKSPVSITEYESVTPPDSANDENDIQESDEDKADDNSNSSDEILPDSKDKDSIPKIVINSPKKSIAEVSESNSVADKPKEEMANKETTLASNKQVTDIETDDVSPSDKENAENIEDISPEEDISQDDEKMNPKSPEVSRNVETIVRKRHVQADSVSEPYVKTEDNSENEAAVKVIQKVPNATEGKDIEEFPQSPNMAYSPADSPTDVESTDSAIEADAKDDEELDKSDEDLKKCVQVQEQSDQDLKNSGQGLEKTDQDLIKSDQDIGKHNQDLVERMEDTTDDAEYKKALLEDDESSSDDDQIPDEKHDQDLIETMEDTMDYAEYKKALLEDDESSSDDDQIPDKKHDQDLIKRMEDTMDDAACKKALLEDDENSADGDQFPDKPAGLRKSDPDLVERMEDTMNVAACKKALLEDDENSTDGDQYPEKPAGSPEIPPDSSK